jgi:hypothetical protein
MNVRRGLFRLWVIFAVLFALVVYLMHYEEFMVQFRDWRYEKQYETEDFVLGPAGEPTHPWRLLCGTSLVAAGVPLSVLALGWSLLWAFSGFKR